MRKKKIDEREEGETKRGRMTERQRKGKWKEGRKTERVKEQERVREKRNERERQIEGVNEGYASHKMQAKNAMQRVATSAIYTAPLGNSCVIQNARKEKAHNSNLNMKMGDTQAKPPHIVQLIAESHSLA